MGEWATASVCRQRSKRTGLVARPRKLVMNKRSLLLQESQQTFSKLCSVFVDEKIQLM